MLKSFAQYDPAVCILQDVTGAARRATLDRKAECLRLFGYIFDTHVPTVPSSLVGVLGVEIGQALEGGAGRYGQSKRMFEN